MKDFDVGNVVKSSLDSYINCKKQRPIEEKRSYVYLCLHNSSTKALSDSRSSNSMSSPTFDSTLESVSVAYVEIRWVIKVVISISSFRPCLELNELFKAMISETS